MSGSKALMKDVIHRQHLTAMESTYNIVKIIGLANEYKRLAPQTNESEFQKFINMLEDGLGSATKKKVTVHTDDEEDVEFVRSLLKDAILGFLQSARTSMPIVVTSIEGIKWRELFLIEIVDVSVVGASDDDSGQGYSATNIT